MGARVGRNDPQKGWEVSVTEVDLTNQGRRFFFDGDKEEQEKEVLVSNLLFSLCVSRFAGARLHVCMSLYFTMTSEWDYNTDA